MASRLPPGPRSTLLSTYKALRAPYEEYRKWVEEYGDPVTIPALNGTVVMTGDPAAVKQIFAFDPQGFDIFAAETVKPLVGERSVLLVTGAHHKRLRKLMAPPFHGARMRAYGQIMIDVARRHLEALTPGESAPIQRVTQAISLEVIVRAVFGFADPARVEESARAMVETMEAVHPAFLFARALQREFFGLGPYARFTRARDRGYALLDAQIAECRARPEGREDILAMLMAARDEDGEGLSDAEIRDQLVTLLIAGHETTAITLAWALYWLHRDDEARARLLAELDGLGDGPLEPEAVAALPYLGAVCSETLRLNPIVPDIIRVLARPMTLKGYELPVGVGVCPAAALVHQRPELYPEPDRWRPERFLERSFGPSEYLPFGGGHRRCIGAAFAVYEMKLVLAVALRGHLLRLVKDGPIRPVRRNITMAPEGGVEMRYEGRRAE
ncbi:MAG: cytochrome P450 [Myxococcales bacterium]|nr:cytochrome P450 [Myxococcales bacterium]MCB9754775.1 cytochrome P450 [Myxococcales bacterium]